MAVALAVAPTSGCLSFRVRPEPTPTGLSCDRAILAAGGDTAGAVAVSAVGTLLLVWGLSDTPEDCSGYCAFADPMLRAGSVGLSIPTLVGGAVMATSAAYGYWNYGRCRRISRDPELVDALRRQREAERARAEAMVQGERRALADMQRALAEQPRRNRLRFAQRLDKDCAAHKPPVHVTTSGDDATTLVVVSEACAKPSARGLLAELIGEGPLAKALSELGFKAAQCRPPGEEARERRVEAKDVETR